MIVQRRGRVFSQFVLFIPYLEYSNTDQKGWVWPPEPKGSTVKMVSLCDTGVPLLHDDVTRSIARKDGYSQTIWSWYCDIFSSPSPRPLQWHLMQSPCHINSFGNFQIAPIDPSPAVWSAFKVIDYPSVYIRCRNVLYSVLKGQRARPDRCCRNIYEWAWTGTAIMYNFREMLSAHIL